VTNRDAKAAGRGREFEVVDRYHLKEGEYSKGQLTPFAIRVTTEKGGGGITWKPRFAGPEVRERFGNNHDP